jgi:hypothetical protein
MVLTEEQENAVNDALDAKLGDDEFAAVTMFLNLSEDSDKHYKALHMLLGRESALKAYVDRLVQLAASDLPEPPSEAQQADFMLVEYKDKFALAKPRERNLLEKLQARSMSGATSALVPAATIASQQATSNAVSACVTFLDQGTVASLENAITAIERCSTIVKYSKYIGRAAWVLQVGLIGYEFYTHIRQWWKGEIDGVACAKGCTTAVTTAAAGLAAGFVCGLALGVPGAIAGGIIGAVVAGQLTGSAFDLFAGDDRARSLSKAYSTLGLRSDASHEDVREKYLTLAKATHPDKGGDKAKFIEINAAYELIRASRVDAD